MFDPLGLCCPVTIKAKVLLQYLWQNKYGWNDIVPDHIKSEWIKIVNELKTNLDYEIPRYIVGATSVPSC